MPVFAEAWNLPKMSQNWINWPLNIQYRSASTPQTFSPPSENPPWQNKSATQKSLDKCLGFSAFQGSSAWVGADPSSPPGPFADPSSSGHSFLTSLTFVHKWEWRGPIGSRLESRDQPGCRQTTGKVKVGQWRKPWGPGQGSAQSKPKEQDRMHLFPYQGLKKQVFKSQASWQERRCQKAPEVQGRSTRCQQRGGWRLSVSLHSW